MESPSTSGRHAVRSAKNLIERMIEGPIDETPHSFDQRHGEFLSSQSSVQEFSETVNWQPVFGTRFKDPEFTMGLIFEPCNFFEPPHTSRPSRSRSHSHAPSRRAGSNSGQSSRPRQGRSRSHSDANSHSRFQCHTQSQSRSQALSSSGQSASPPFGTFTARDGRRLSTKVTDNFTSSILTMLVTDFQPISQLDSETEASFELSGFGLTGSRLNFRVRKRLLHGTSIYTPARPAFTPLSEVDTSEYMADASEDEKQGGKWVLIDILSPAAKQQASAQPGENPFGTPEAVAVTTRSLYIPTSVTFTPR
ncbi:hypothetical protein EHS25_009375 [Saitozyma podzolica]|uniref:Uncharacterized protein n=1 Tax=Saitozyma podzolica TaxID=1890683 RepID=A0A427YLL5_9TREE|nr:hypothetical protein EHS25_009375 [Saitozyma podzolica]